MIFSTVTQEATTVKKGSPESNVAEYQHRVSGQAFGRIDQTNGDRGKQGSPKSFNKVLELDADYKVK